MIDWDKIMAPQLHRSYGAGDGEEVDEKGEGERGEE